MAKIREKMTLRHGKVKELADICEVSTVTVRRALRYDSDTEIQAAIRKKARELGFVRAF